MNIYIYIYTYFLFRHQVWVYAPSEALSFGSVFLAFAWNFFTDTSVTL